MRRKIVRKTKPSTAQDDKKLQGALKKLNVQPIPGVEEVNMFREDGNVLHFSTPKGTCRIIVYMSLCIFPSIIMSVPCVQRCADRCGGMPRPDTPSLITGFALSADTPPVHDDLR